MSKALGAAQNRKWRLNKKWLFFVCMLVVLIFILVVFHIFVFTSFDDGGFLSRATDGFPGNLIAEFLGGVVFLFLALYLNFDTESRIERVSLLAELSEKKLSEREASIASQEKHNRFIEILKKHTSYNIAIISLQGEELPFGPIFEIEIPKDNGSIVTHSSGGIDYYPIRVLASKLSSRVQTDRKWSFPIKYEWYFAFFANNRWLLSSDGYRDSFEFVPFGKLYQPRIVLSANEVMFSGGNEDSLSLLATFDIPLLIPKATTSGSGFGCKLLEDTQNNLWVRLDHSPLKRVYFTQKRGNIDTNWFFCIEDLHGYGDFIVIQNIETRIRQEIEKLKVDIPKIPWWSLD